MPLLEGQLVGNQRQGIVRQPVNSQAMLASVLHHPNEFEVELGVLTKLDAYAGACSTASVLREPVSRGWRNIGRS